MGLVLAVAFIAGFLLLARPGRPEEKEELAVVATAKSPADAGGAVVVPAEAGPAAGSTATAAPAVPPGTPGAPAGRTGRARAANEPPFPQPRDGTCIFDATIYEV